MQTPYWSFEEYSQALRTPMNPASAKARVMYSSLTGAMVSDVRCMQIPVEDHLVHRGVGVFETLLFEGGRVYNLKAHMERLWASAATIQINVPLERARLEQVIDDCFEVAAEERALAKVLVGRGLGGFSVDPAECKKASLYVIVYKAPPPFMERYPDGAKVILSVLPPKSGGLARVKTCNYIPNALMKAEANAAGVHFALGVDEQGYLTESATENIAGLRKDGTLVVPPSTHHLPGTTLKRVVELAIAGGRKVIELPLKPEDLFDLAEVIIAGTTAYVTQVVEMNGTPLPVGPVAGELNDLLLTDIYQAGGAPQNW